MVSKWHTAEAARAEHQNQQCWLADAESGYFASISGTCVSLVVALTKEKEKQQEKKEQSAPLDAMTGAPKLQSSPALTKELIKIVLYWCAGEQDPALAAQSQQGGNGLAALSSFQPACNLLTTQHPAFHAATMHSWVLCICLRTAKITVNHPKAPHQRLTIVKVCNFLTGMPACTIVSVSMQKLLYAVAETGRVILNAHKHSMHSTNDMMRNFRLAADSEVCTHRFKVDVAAAV